MKNRTIIETAFRDIPDIYSGFSLMRDLIYQSALEGEKRHRPGRPSPRNFPASVAAKYFVVKWLAGYASGRDKLPTIADVHSLRPDVVLSASFAADYTQTLGAWANSIPAAFWEIDYAELMGATA